MVDFVIKIFEMLVLRYWNTYFKINNLVILVACIFQNFI